PRKGNSRGLHEAPQNPTAKRPRTRATSSPSAATAKTSNTGTRDGHGFLTQKTKVPGIRLILCLNSSYPPLLSKFATWMAAKQPGPLEAFPRDVQTYDLMFRKIIS